MSSARKLRAAALGLALCATAFAAGELGVRSRVPRSGVTPFRLSDVEGVSSELRPGFRTLYKGFEVEINSRGFRGPEPEPPRPGVRRIALVGDSMVFGNGVGWEDTLGVRLERRLAERGVEARVLNCGVPGHNAQDAAALLGPRVLPQAPDTVVYVFFSNDLEPTREWGEIPPEAVLDSFHGFPLGSALLEWLAVHLKVELQRRGVSTSKRTPAMSARELERGRAAFRRAVEGMRDDCRRSGARFLVAAYPFLCPPGTNPFEPLDEGARAVCAELDVEFLALADAFAPGEDLTRYWSSAFDIHPNGAAHDRAAEHLARVLAGDG